MMFPRISWAPICSAMAVSFAFIAPAPAAISLTASASGYTLTAYASTFNVSGSIGPLGIAFVGNTVLVADYSGNIRIFPNHNDGQIATVVPLAQNYTLHNAVGLAQVGSNISMTGHWRCRADQSQRHV